MTIINTFKALKQGNSLVVRDDLGGLWKKILKLKGQDQRFKSIHKDLLTALTVAAGNKDSNRLDLNVKGALIKKLLKADHLPSQERIPVLIELAGKNSDLKPIKLDSDRLQLIHQDIDEMIKYYQSEKESPESVDNHTKNLHVPHEPKKKFFVLTPKDPIKVLERDLEKLLDGDDLALAVEILKKGGSLAESIKKIVGGHESIVDTKITVLQGILAFHEADQNGIFVSEEVLQKIVKELSGISFKPVAYELMDLLYSKEISDVSKRAMIPEILAGKEAPKEVAVPKQQVPAVKQETDTKEKQIIGSVDNTAIRASLEGISINRSEKATVDAVLALPLLDSNPRVDQRMKHKLLSPILNKIPIEEAGGSVMAKSTSSEGFASLAQVARFISIIQNASSQKEDQLTEVAKKYYPAVIEFLKTDSKQGAAPRDSFLKDLFVASVVKLYCDDRVPLVGNPENLRVISKNMLTRCPAAANVRDLGHLERIVSAEKRDIQLRRNLLTAGFELTRVVEEPINTREVNITVDQVEKKSPIYLANKIFGRSPVPGFDASRVEGSNPISDIDTSSTAQAVPDKKAPQSARYMVAAQVDNIETASNRQFELSVNGKDLSFRHLTDNSDCPTLLIRGDNVVVVDSQQDNYKVALKPGDTIINGMVQYSYDGSGRYGQPAVIASYLKEKDFGNIISLLANVQGNEAATKALKLAKQTKVPDELSYVFTPETNLLTQEDSLAVTKTIAYQNKMEFLKKGVLKVLWGEAKKDLRLDAVEKLYKEAGKMA